MASTRKLMTADELWWLPDDGMRHELVAGALLTMAPPGRRHGWQGNTIGYSLTQHVNSRQLGLVITGELGVVLARDPDTVRSPDVAFIRRERVLEVGDIQKYWPGPPDLAVEVILPGDVYKEVDEKAAAWLAYGTRMVVVVNPRRRTVAVHRTGRDVRILTLDETLDGEDVVPGWQLPPRQIFTHPVLG